MRPRSTALRHARPAALLALFLVPACGGGDGPTGRSPAATTLRLDRNVLTLGDNESTQLTAAVLDQDGRPFSPAAGTLVWSSSDESVATATTSGLTATVAANRRGQVKIRVRLGTLADSAALTVNAVAAAVAPVAGDLQPGTAGSVLADSVAVRVTDRHGQGVEGVTVRFTVTAGGGSVSPATAPSRADGVAKAAWTMGPLQGENRLEAAVEALGAPGKVPFRASVGGDAPLAITGISPDTLRPGGSVTVRGRGFGTAPQLRVGGVLLSVTSASDAELVATIPAREALGCRPAGPVAVEVAVGGASARYDHPLRVAPPRALAVGEAAHLSAEELRCSSLAGGRYLVSVFNAGASLQATTGYRFVGTAEGAAAGDVAPQRVSVRGDAAPRRAATAADAMHARVLEKNRELVRRLGPPRPEPLRPRGARAQVSAPGEGDVLALRIPDLDSDNLCTEFISVSARVVYSGTRAVVLEDAAAPLAGTMDADYRAIGQEMDNVQFGVLSQHFGNPLAYDASLDANGRILMLFSKVVNDFGGVAGFVTSADFYPRATCPSSNRAEIFYAIAPTSNANSFASSSRQGWFWSIRSTVIHEVKHLTSYAERFSRGGSSLEAGWLEEATARVSEELWARTLYGFARKGNTDYAASVYCEQRPSQAECLGRPLAMYKHFNSLYDYYDGILARSPLGSTGSGDATYYASGWQLVRWAADNFSASDEAFLQGLTQEPHLTGVNNLQARTGRSWRELLGDWTLAHAADDLPGFTAASARHRHESWNTRSVFAGMNAALPSGFPRAFPLGTQTLPTGAFSVEVTQQRGGGAVLFDLQAPAAGQLVEVRGLGAAAPDPTVGVAVLRIQ